LNVSLLIIVVESPFGLVTVTKLKDLSGRYPASNSPPIGP
jgi:hypothetical protein